MERLLAATGGLLAAEGYPAVTVANLKAITGMPHSTIYDVVADPRDLVAVLVVRTLDEMHEALAASAARIVDAVEVKPRTSTPWAMRSPNGEFAFMNS